MSLKASISLLNRVSLGESLEPPRRPAFLLSHSMRLASWTRYFSAWESLIWDGTVLAAHCQNLETHLARYYPTMKVVS